MSTKQQLAAKNAILANALIEIIYCAEDDTPPSFCTADEWGNLSFRLGVVQARALRALEKINHSQFDSLSRQSAEKFRQALIAAHPIPAPTIHELPLENVQ